MSVINQSNTVSDLPDVGPEIPFDPAENFDALLELSRRVDWRFLLPVPGLDKVACVGRADESLIDSLRQFSASLTLFETAAEARAAGRQFNTVVAHAARWGDLERLTGCVRVGGWLYLEVFGRLGPAKRRQSKPPAAFVEQLDRLGFCEIAAHWHWPDFNSCTQIVPLGERSALMHVLRQHAKSGKSRTRSLGGRLLLSCGLLHLLVRSFSIVACRPEP